VGARPWAAPDDVLALAGNGVRLLKLDREGSEYAILDRARPMQLFCPTQEPMVSARIAGRGSGRLSWAIHSWDGS
jgi:hypothetical protein